MSAGPRLTRSFHLQKSINEARVIVAGHVAIATTAALANSDDVFKLVAGNGALVHVKLATWMLVISLCIIVLNIGHAMQQLPSRQNSVYARTRSDSVTEDPSLIPRVASGILQYGTQMAVLALMCGIRDANMIFGLYGWAGMFFLHAVVHTQSDSNPSNKQPMELRSISHLFSELIIGRMTAAAMWVPICLAYYMSHEPSVLMDSRFDTDTITVFFWTTLILYGGIDVILNALNLLNFPNMCTGTFTRDALLGLMYFVFAIGVFICIM